MGHAKGATAVHLLLSLVLAWAFGASAQTPPLPPRPVPTPAVVPQSSELAPLQVVPPGDVPLPERPPARELAKPEDDVRIDVVRYVVADDAPAALRAALPRITERYVGKDRSFEDLVNAAGEVTRFLQRDLGFYLGYAYLPEQTPADGVVRIAVLEGRLDKVVLNWTDGLPVDRDVVEAYLARLQPGTILRVRDVERVVFLVNDLRGITARFEVRAGSTPGTAQLVVTPRAESVWTGKVDFDANGSRFMGVYEVGGLVQMASPFGRGDGFTANALMSTTGGLGFALFGYTTPVGSDGIKLGASVSGVRYQLDKDIFPLDLNGTALTINAYGLYPVVRSRNLNLFALASYEHKMYEDRQEAAGGVTKKTVDTLAIGTTGDFRDSLLGGGVNTYQLSAVTGTLKFPEGRPGGLDDPDRFTKFTFGFTRLQDVLTGRMLAYVALRGQQALQNLDTTEQFRLGGPEGVRAFAPGEGTGDTGALLSIEMRFLPPEDWFGRIAREMVAAVFFDAGTVRYRTDPRPDPITGNSLSNTASFTGAGFGLSWVRPNEYALRFSIAKPISGTPRSDPQVKDPRLYLLASKLFN
jgi:hemolysin activation/secretion protein